MSWDFFYKMIKVNFIILMRLHSNILKMFIFEKVIKENL